MARKRTIAAAKGAERLLGGSGERSPPEKQGGAGVQPPRLPPPELEPTIIFKLPINRPGGRYVTDMVMFVPLRWEFTEYVFSESLIMHDHH